MMGRGACRIMFLKMYYVHDGCNVHGIGFLAVEACTNGGFGALREYGLFPCFSRCGFSIVFALDSGHYFFNVVNGRF